MRATLIAHRDAKQDAQWKEHDCTANRTYRIIVFQHTDPADRTSTDHANVAWNTDDHSLR